MLPPPPVPVIVTMPVVDDPVSDPVARSPPPAPLAGLTLLPPAPGNREGASFVPHAEVIHAMATRIPPSPLIFAPMATHATCARDPLSKSEKNTWLAAGCASPMLSNPLKCCGEVRVSQTWATSAELTPKRVDKGDCEPHPRQSSASRTRAHCARERGAAYRLRGGAARAASASTRARRRGAARRRACRGRRRSGVRKRHAVAAATRESLATELQIRSVVDDTVAIVIE